MKLKGTLAVGIISLFFYSANFANSINAPSCQYGEICNWKFIAREDGMYFLLGPDTKYKLVINVNKLAPNGKMSDPVSLFCNNIRYQIAPGDRVTCYGNFNDVIAMQVHPDIFKNGAEGKYEFVPL